MMIGAVCRTPLIIMKSAVFRTNCGNVGSDAAHFSRTVVMVDLSASSAHRVAVALPLALPSALLNIYQVWNDPW